MKVVIIYQQHKVTIESSKEIKVKDVFKYFRSEYPIGLRENLLLVGNDESYEENEFKEEEALKSEENFKKSNLANYVLVSIDNKYQESEKINSKSKYDLENIIMRVTGAQKPLNSRNFAAKGRRYQLRRDHDFLSPAYIDELLLGRNEFLDDFSEGDSTLMERAGLISNSNEGNMSQNFLGRVRARDPLYLPNIVFSRRGQSILQTESQRNQDQNTSNQSNLNSSSNGVFRMNRIPHFFDYFDNPYTHSGRLFNRSSSVPREEDIRRLVNEMGFDENRVRIALREARNNVNRAVDLLINGPEEIFLENSEGQNRPSLNSAGLIEDNEAEANNNNTESISISARAESRFFEISQQHNINQESSDQRSARLNSRVFLSGDNIDPQINIVQNNLDSHNDRNYLLENDDFEISLRPYISHQQQQPASRLSSEGNSNVARLGQTGFSLNFDMQPGSNSQIEDDSVSINYDFQDYESGMNYGDQEYDPLFSNQEEEENMEESYQSDEN
jgi:hypothetical protein